MNHSEKLKLSGGEQGNRRAARILRFGAVSGCLGVALGAFAAHGLKERLDPHHLEVFKTGATYQLLHSVVLIGVSAWMAQAQAQFKNPMTERILARAALFFGVGILLFSGSLYALALSGLPLLGAITPFGGLSFMAGWLTLAWSTKSRG